MSTGVAVKVTNNQSGKSATNQVPINGKQQSIGAVFSGSFPDGKVIASVIEVQKPAEAQGVEIKAGPANGPFNTVKSDGTPLKTNEGQPLDITGWVIGATKL